MLLHLIMSSTTTLLNNVYSALPVCNFQLGDGFSPGIDNNGARDAVFYVCVWDHFLPIYDLFLPIFAIQFAIFVGMAALKVFFKGASFIPTINAGG